MLHSPEDAPVRRVARPTGHADDPPRHRDHGAAHLLAVQPDPGHPRRQPRHRRHVLLRRLRARPVAPAAAAHADPAGAARSSACSRSSSSSSRSCGAALERIGRVGSFGWLLARRPSSAAVEHVAAEVAKAAALLSRDGHGALIVLERETGLEEIAETGVMVHADLSSDCSGTIFAPRTSLHDGAVIIRDDRDPRGRRAPAARRDDVQSERFGTRHRAALGITEQTDAVASSCPRRAARSASSSGRGSSAT